MAFPEEQIRQEALLCLIYFLGFKGDSDYQLAPNETYEPLADYFKLTEFDRNRLEGDEKRSAWMINIQGTRERLAQKGYIRRPSPNKVWKLTPTGIEKAKQLSQYYIRLKPVSDLETPKAEDLNEPPTVNRIECQIYRILRDTDLARRMKALYEYQCQLCGYTIQLNNGKRYAEAHHIKPLGAPHNGDDSDENIICVCPNHHVELDYGLIELNKASIRNLPTHTIGDKYINYHNTVIFRKR